MQKAKKVFFHDDPPCEARLNDDRYCPACNLIPDMQSLAIGYYCPECGIALTELKCPMCDETFESP